MVFPLLQCLFKLVVFTVEHLCKHKNKKLCPLYTPHIYKHVLQETTNIELECIKFDNIERNIQKLWRHFTGRL